MGQRSRTSAPTTWRSTRRTRRLANVRRGPAARRRRARRRDRARRGRGRQTARPSSRSSRAASHVVKYEKVPELFSDPRADGLASSGPRSPTRSSRRRRSTSTARAVGRRAAPHTDTGDVLVPQIDGRKDREVRAAAAAADAGRRRGRAGACAASSRRTVRRARPPARPRAATSRRAVGGGARRAAWLTTRRAAAAVRRTTRPPARRPACERITPAPATCTCPRTAPRDRAAEGDDGEAGSAAHLTSARPRGRPVVGRLAPRRPVVGRRPNASAACPRRAARGPSTRPARARARSARARARTRSRARRPRRTPTRPRTSPRCAKAFLRGRSRSTARASRPHRWPRAPRLRPPRRALRRVGGRATRRALAVRRLARARRGAAQGRARAPARQRTRPRDGRRA